MSIQQPGMNSEGGTHLPRRGAHRRRRAARAALWAATAALCAAMLGLALLPHWIPEEWLRARVSGEMSRVFGRPVSVRELRMSWAEGLVARGVSVADARVATGDSPEREGAALVEVDELLCTFHPWSLLTGGGLRRLEVRSPRIHLRVDGAGRLNLDGLDLSGRPPEQLVVRESRIDLHDARSGARSAVRLGDVALAIDPKTGRTEVRLDGRLIRSMRSDPAGEEDGGRFATTASLTLPAAARDEGAGAATSPAGAGELRWESIDLSSLPIRLVPELRGARLAGFCTGRLRATLGADLEQRWQLEAEVRDLAYDARPEEEGLRLTEASIEGEGRWLPAYDVLELSRLSYRMPGLEVRGRPLSEGRTRPGAAAPVLWWSLHGETALQVSLAGRLDDVGRLKAWLPERWRRAVFGAEGAERAAGGGVGFELEWTGQRAGVRWSGSVRSDGLALGEGWPVRVSAEEPVEASGYGRIDDAEGVATIESFEARLGGLAVSGGARLPLRGVGTEGESSPAEWLQQWWRRGATRVDVAAEDLAEVVRRLPGVHGSLGDVVVSGPARLSGSMTAGERGTEVRLEGVLAERSVLAAAGLIEKRAGRALRFDCGSVYPPEPDGVFRDVTLSLTYGRGAVRTLAGDGGAERQSIRVAIRRGAEGAEGTGAAAGRANGAYTVDAAVRLALQVEAMEELAALLPRVFSAGGRLDAGGGEERLVIGGDGRIDVAANVRHVTTGGVMWPELWRVSATADVADTVIRIGERFEKPRGEAASAGLDYWFDRRRERGAHRIEGVIRMDGGEVAAIAAFGGGHERVALRVQADDVGRLAGRQAWGRGIIERYGLRGGLSVRAEVGNTPTGAERSFDVDLMNLGFAVPRGAEAVGDEPAWRKPQAVPCRVAARLRSGRGAGAGGLVRWEVEALEATLAGCRFDAPRGYVTLDGRFEAELLTALSTMEWESLLSTRAMRQLELTADATVVVDTTLRSLGPGLAALAESYDLIGRCDGTVHVEGYGQKLRLSGAVDATRMNLRWPDVMTKSAGIPAELRWDVGIAAAAGGGHRVRIEGASCGLGGASVTARGELAGALDMTSLGSGEAARAWRPESAWMEVEFDCPSIEELPRITLPGLPTEAGVLRLLSGGVNGRVAVEWTPRGVTIGTSEARLRDARVLVRARDAAESLSVAVTGGVTFSSAEVASRGLTIRAEESELTVAGRLDGLRDGARGTVIASGRRLEWPRLAGVLSRLTGRKGTEAGDEGLRRLLDYLARCDVRCVMHCRDAVFPGQSVGTLFAVQELSTEFRIGGGRLEVPFHCAVNGGVLSGGFSLPLDTAEPYFDLAYEARGLGPEENTRPIVESFFPGMTVTGPLTLVDRSHQRLFARPGEANHPTGSGEMVIEGGTIVGRAAPLWVTSIFPRLNLASFDFTRMVNRFEKLPDGRHNNTMTFFGEYYNLYVDGYSTATGEARYEVGVDLLARVSPDLAREGQGRVALFIKTGTIRNGRMEDEAVSYLTPVQVTRKILTNNVLTIAYHAIKKQVLSLSGDV